MAKLAALMGLLAVAMAMATILSVHCARILEKVDQVTILEVSSVEKPPSSTLLEAAALIPFDGPFEEVADGPIAAGWHATDYAHETPVFIPFNGPFEEAAGYHATDGTRKTPVYGP
jgi:hypothetical protein